MTARIISAVALPAPAFPGGWAQEEKKEDLSALVTAIVEAPDEASRAAILAEHPEAKTQDFVFEVLKLGEALINKGEFDRAPARGGVS